MSSVLAQRHTLVPQLNQAVPLLQIHLWPCSINNQDLIRALSRCDAVPIPRKQAVSMAG